MDEEQDMKALDAEAMFRLTGLMGGDWDDEAKLTEAEAWLTDPGTHEELTEWDRRLIPLALIAVRSAMAQVA